ncbi:MAG: hypothetical protein F2564_01310 [Actinobacteria bacterium]|nr:hypothetical protein [Actinomycetota bacterium]
MKIKVLVLAIFFSLLPSPLVFAAGVEQPWDLARLVSVEDGDTIRVRLETNKSVRNI